MKSLKLAAKAPVLATNGVIVKAEKPKAPYEAAFAQHAKALETPTATFDATKLAAQNQ